MNSQSYSNQQLNVSKQYWQGLQSSKFKGGRFHNNHPLDELDAMLSGSKSKAQSQGKKQFHNIDTHTSSESKSNLKTFPIKYKKSTIFQTQNLKQLIKIPFKSEELTSHDQKVKPNKQYQTIGASKIKALQKGYKQTGIYRNFYESICKSTNMIAHLS